MPVGNTLAYASFGEDDGSVDPSVAAALAAYEQGEGGPADVLAALAGGRVLVPVVAVPDSAHARSGEENGDEAERAAAHGSTEMAVASTIGRDGRRGLLAFTCVESLRRWNPQARPVPVSTRAAAESALADGADALVIDIAGPVLFSVDAEGLRALASGYRPVVTWGAS
ncbi:SseB family protein [Phytoactinopolyspora halotolerans]|uniref:SseB family protein n=1 Tax=Phytoactinopolyspora halotolerans TaxID=1981512 RepID=A0A6L9SB58_9ACTN|nr:SseB family protein [Phytoactinopolyspora halotolerans]NEE01844.1 SseB family protein [Phytoactinopolyspora halotolerans]